MGTNPPSLDQTGLAKVLFTDESPFCLTRGEEGMRVYTEACTLERDRFAGGGSVMVWGGVSQHHRTELLVIVGNLNAVRYMEDISSSLTWYPSCRLILT